MNYTGLVLADIHIGAMCLDTIEREFRELVLNRIVSMENIDFIVFCGDFFDKRFYLNDKSSVVAYRLLKSVIELCKKHQIVLRFVYGTESHECGQYDILTNLKLYDDVKVIRTACKEELLPGMTVLYLPEEHVLNKEEYYAGTLYDESQRVDYIFGHGILREVMRDIAVHVENKGGKSESRKRVPLFKTNELLNICDGEVYFGHYHINNEYQDRVFSIGSFTRWRYGEEERKGFYEVTCDTENKKYTHKYIENTMADPYATITFGYKNEIFSNDDELQNKLDKINALSKHNESQHTRYIFNVPTDSENPESTISIIKDRLKETENVKVEIANGYIEEKRRSNKEKLNIENEKFSFIFDKSIPLEDKVKEFIKISYDKDIPINNIKKYLYEELKEIME